MFLASLELSFWLATLSSGCIAGSQEVRIIILASGRPVALVLLGDSWVPQNVVGASANSLWQGGWRRTHSVKGGLPK